jgi:hypothetical protein
VEVFGAEEFVFLVRWVLVPQRIGLGFVLVLIGEAFIALSHAIVGNQRVDGALGELLQILFDVKTQFQCRVT